VRVGGRLQATFGMPGESPFVEANEYREVVPDERLVFDMTLARDGRVFSRSRCTVELVAQGERTQLILIDEGEDAGEHASGWGPALSNLAKFLA
jgi:uncharacterized protein YndB with AHSA1/START domain